MSCSHFPTAIGCIQHFTNSRELKWQQKIALGKREKKSKGGGKCKWLSTA